MQEAETILEILSRKSMKDEKYVFQRLYRMLFNKEMYMKAYTRIYGHEGNMTPGTDGKTIDGFSEQLVEELIEELKSERYYPKAVRRTYIPKKSGKLRPLGIPSFRDKIVQEVVRMILEAIYEPTFSENSHGFRPNRSCQTALYQIKTEGKGTSWVIEGDIEAFFDSIDHDILLGILEKRISDGRFLELIRRFLKAGYMEFKTVYRTLSGTPQGGIISPILSNIYLHELDTFVKGLEQKYNKGKERAANPEYRKLESKRRYLRRKGRMEEAKKILKTMWGMQSQDMMDANYARVRYIRYADDFVILVIGSKKLAEDVREEIRDFLKRNLKLNLNMEKTKITNLGNEKVRFLGYDITKAWDDTRITKGTNGLRRRAINGTIQLLVPSEVITEHLKPFTRNGKPADNAARENLPLLDMVNIYNSEIRGLYNYYCMATDVSSKVRKFLYYHYFSLLKTIARREKISVRRVLDKYGLEVRTNDNKGRKRLLAVRYMTTQGEKTLTYFNEPIETHKQPLSYNGKLVADKLVVEIPQSQLITRINAKKCEYCGREGGKIEVHHVRKLKDVVDRYRKRGKETPEWVKRMARMKRKTLVLCSGCHDKLHAGKLDNKAVNPAK